MHTSAVTALAAVGRVNVALCERWLDFSFRSVEHAQRLSLAAFEVFCERPLVTAQVAAVKTASAARAVMTPVIVPPTTTVIHTASTIHASVASSRRRSGFRRHRHSALLVLLGCLPLIGPSLLVAVSSGR